MTLKNFANKVDMSSKAITVRLKRVSQLRTLCISLGQAKKTNAYRDNYHSGSE